MKTWLIALSVCWLGMAVPAAAQLPLDPQPRKVVWKQGVFNLKKKTYIFADDSQGAKPAARTLRDYCRKSLGKKLTDPHSLPDKGNRIAFYGDDRLPEGGYALRMYKDMIEVRAGSSEGFDAAVHTLMQLMRTRMVPLVNVDDEP